MRFGGWAGWGALMKVALIVEGKTEKAFLSVLRCFLERHLAGRMPNIDPVPYDGRIPTGDKLKRLVFHLLSGSRPADHVIALSDVYTGSHPPDFMDASDLKEKCDYGSAQNQDFTLMRPSMISRLGCFPTGQQYNAWQDTTGRDRQATRNGESPQPTFISDQRNI